MRSARLLLAYSGFSCTMTWAIMLHFTMPQPFISIYGLENAEGRVDNVSTQFQYNIADSVITSTHLDGGFITTFTSMAILTTDGAVGAHAGIESKNNLEYRSGHEAYAYFTVAFSGAIAANTTQFIGLFDDENGFAVGFNGTTFNILLRSNISDTFITQANFNGDPLDGTGPSGFTYEETDLNVFRIGYGWLGASIIRFQIMASNGKWITFHTINQPNSSSTPSIGNPMLPIRAQIVDTIGGNQLELRTASWNSGIVGTQSTVANRYFSVNNTTAIPVLTETHVLTIRNKNTFQSEANKVNIRLSQWITLQNPNAGICQLYKNATVTGTTFTDVDTDASVTEFSSVGTYVASTGIPTAIRPALNASNANAFGLYFPNDLYNITLFPGETLTITALALSVAQNIIGSLAWSEGF